MLRIVFTCIVYDFKYCLNFGNTITIQFTLINDAISKSKPLAFRASLVKRETGLWNPISTRPCTSVWPDSKITTGLSVGRCVSGENAEIWRASRSLTLLVALRVVRCVMFAMLRSPIADDAFGVMVIFISLPCVVCVLWHWKKPYRKVVY